MYDSCPSPISPDFGGLTTNTHSGLTSTTEPDSRIEPQDLDEEVLADLRRRKMFAESPDPNPIREMALSMLVRAKGDIDRLFDDPSQDQIKEGIHAINWVTAVAEDPESITFEECCSIRKCDPESIRTPYLQLIKQLPKPVLKRILEVL